MVAQRQPPLEPMTEADYLAFERASDRKHEFINGDIIMMSGASANHNLITGNIIASFHRQLRGKGCKTYPSDLRVRIPNGSYVYPDVTVTCGEAQFNENGGDVLLTPTVIVEVLSPSTERYDVTAKAALYRSIPSLQAYVLVAQDQPHVEVYTRQPDSWLLREASTLDEALAIEPIGCQLALADVYEQVDFSSPEAEPESNERE